MCASQHFSNKDINLSALLLSNWSSSGKGPCHFSQHLLPATQYLTGEVIRKLYIPYGLQPARLLRPWDSPGKNAGVDRHTLVQRIFLTQGPNPLLSHLLHWQEGSLTLAQLGSLQVTNLYVWMVNCVTFIFIF